MKNNFHMQIEENEENEEKRTWNEWERCRRMTNFLHQMQMQ
jgi:hypothetical protein